MALMGEVLKTVGILIGTGFGAALIILFIYHLLQFNKQMHMLLDECDPVKFSTHYRKKLTSQKLTQKGRNIFICYLCLGLYYCGEYDEMQQWIQEASVHSKHTGLGKIMLLQHQLSLHLVEKEYDLAQQRLEQMEELIASERQLKLYKLLKDDIEYNRFLISLALRNASNAEETLVARLAQAKCMLSRVLIKGALAEVYISNGQTEKAIDALKYVVQHGNRLHVVSLAKQQLWELGEPVVIAKSFLEGYTCNG